MTRPNRQAIMDAEFTLELVKLCDMLKARTGLDIVCLLCVDSKQRIATIAGPDFDTAVGPAIVTALQRGGMML